MIMSTTNTTRIVTGEVRLSYAHVWEPNSIQGGKPKYSVSLIIPKSDTATITAIERAVDAWPLLLRSTTRRESSAVCRA